MRASLVLGAMIIAMPGAAVRANGPSPATPAASGKGAPTIDVEKAPAVAPSTPAPAQKPAPAEAAAPAPVTSPSADAAPAAAGADTRAAPSPQTAETAAPPAPAAAPPPAEPAKAVAQPPAKPARPARDAEGRRVIQLHPLQEARPDRNIVVCEAGCLGTTVVFDGAKARPIGEASPEEIGRVKDAYCKGGCYPNPSGFTNAGGYEPPAAAVPRLLDESAGRWMTTIIPGDLPAKAAPVAPVAPAAPAVQAPATPKAAPGSASSGKRDDWLARINRAREEERGEKPAGPGAPPPLPNT